MKKIMMFLFAALLGLNAFAYVQQPPEQKNKVTHNKVTQNKATKKSAKGVKHGAYDVSHNKATKKTNINEGNQKYKNKDDIK